MSVCCPTAVLLYIAPMPPVRMELATVHDPGPAPPRAAWEVLLGAMAEVHQELDEAISQLDGLEGARAVPRAVPPRKLATIAKRTEAGIEDESGAKRIEWLIRREFSCDINKKYMGARSLFVEAITRLVDELQCAPFTLELAMQYCDVVLSMDEREISSKTAMTLAVACFAVAAKMINDNDKIEEEIKFSKLASRLNGLLKEDLRLAEEIVCERLDWNLRISTMTVFLREFVSQGVMAQKDRHQDECCCENCQPEIVRLVQDEALSLCDIAQRQGIVYLYGSLRTAAAAVAVARHLHGVTNVHARKMSSMPSTLARRLGVTQQELERPFHELLRAHGIKEREELKAHQMQKAKKSAASRKRKATALPECCVCLEDEVTHSYPCGHFSVCGKCVLANMHICPVCRGTGPAQKQFFP